MEPKRIPKVIDLIAFFDEQFKGADGYTLMKSVLILLLLAATPALGWSEPARGSADRKGMLDAVGPHAAWALGAPIEFVVTTLRMEGPFGFVMVNPQRPGGAEIDVALTPMGLRAPEDVTFMDGTQMQAWLEKSGDTWVAVHWAIGATDAWFVAPEFCTAYRPVIGDFCR